MEKGRLIIDGVDVSGSVGSAASVPYSNTNSGLEATNVQGAIDELNSNLTNENSETFNFGIKDGVRGYYTNPSRADDCFIPFKKNMKPNLVSYVKGGTAITGSNSTNVGNYSATQTYNFEVGKKYILQIIAGNSWDNGDFTFGVSATNTEGWTQIHYKIVTISRSKSACNIYLIEPKSDYTSTISVSGTAKAYYMDIIVHFSLFNLVEE